MAEGLVRIGQITSAHGVRGDVRVFPLTDFPERFEALGEALLGEEARRVRVTFRGTVRNLLILKLEGVDDRNAAEKLRGAYLQVARDNVHPPPEGYYYAFQLIGLHVVDPDGQPLGQVLDFENGTAHDLYVIKQPNGHVFRVPAVAQFVEQIDLEAGRLVIRPIPGLMD